MEAVQFPYKIPMYYVSSEVFREKVEGDNCWMSEVYMAGQSKALVDAHLMMIPRHIYATHKVYYSFKEGIIYIEENNDAI